MRGKSHSSGGKHIAIERGLLPAWSGWPFRREIPDFPRCGKKRRKSGRRPARVFGT